MSVEETIEKTIRDATKAEEEVAKAEEARRRAELENQD